MPELEFGGAVTKESQFTDIPDGEYDFRVEKIERARHPGSEKIPACGKMVAHLTVTLPDGGTAKLQENFVLWDTLEWKLSQFFICIGLKKKGEPLPACDWIAEIPGRTGRAKIKRQPDRNDPTKSYSHVDTFLEPKPRDWSKGGF